MAWSLDLDEVEDYRREGCLVVDSALDSGALQRLDDAIREVIETALGSDDQAKVIELEAQSNGDAARVRRIRDPYDRHPAFREIAHDARIVDRVESLIGSNIELHHSKLNMKPALVGSEVDWHQDLAYYPHTNDSVLAVLIYIDDASESNGCIQVLPGMHRSYLAHTHPNGEFAGRVIEPTDAEPRLLPAPAGSAVFLHGPAPHSSLPNRSRDDRRTLIFAYRSGDAYPLFYGLRTAMDEARPIPVRGRRASHARFGGPSPIVPEINDVTVSLYDIQATSRQAAGSTG
jgi:ectoine hydroxylase-related dioxygenase (phytanoyl-CoA dioxygenase family)